MMQNFATFGLITLCGFSLPTSLSFLLVSLTSNTSITYLMVLVLELPKSWGTENSELEWHLVASIDWTNLMCKMEFSACED